jgi:Zn-dependent protease
MDEIQISAEAGMPRTLYWNNEVSPDVHRLRAIGGLIFNLLGLLLSLAIYGVVPGNSIAWELAAWSAAGHGLLFIMSLAPVPMVDGGTILKWTLVARGRTVAKADEIVRRVDWVMGIVAGIVGVVLIALKIWIAGVILVGIGIVILCVAAGKIR